MKRTIAFILMFFLTKAYSQLAISRINSYEFSKEIEVVKTVTVTMPYNKPDVLLVTGDIVSLENAGDILINIICTDFPATSTLSKLNSQRLAQVYKLFPYLKFNKIQKITVIRQMDGSQKNIAQNMFHGVVIKFRPAQTKETMINDLSKLEQILTLKEEESIVIRISDSLRTKKQNNEEKRKTVKTDSLIKKHHLKFKGPASHISGGVHPDWLFSNGHDSSCYLVISPRDALRLGYISRKVYRGTRKFRGFKAYELITIGVCTGSDSLKGKEEFYSLNLDSTSITNYSLNMEKHPLPDSTLFKIFKRNKWAKMDIVGDVTGSMYPYTAQLLLWLKLQSLDSLTAHYSFFNDGDNLPDRKKKTGKTGGIYSQNCTTFSDVLNLVKSTMMKGGGGDCPENNIEAILQSEERFPTVDFHVLIADNWASIKDISIAKQIAKPVRIVLCGVLDNAINTDYLDLARITKGSVHLIENDLFNLATLHEGEVLRIGKREFKIINGHFKDITENVQQRL